MKALFTGLIVLLIAVALAMVIREDPGYVMITVRDWTIESSFVVFLVAGIAAFAALYYLVRLLSVSRDAPSRYQRWRRLRRERSSMKRLAQGYANLASCQWRDAEAAFVNSAKNNSLPYLSYLFAARAALKQGENARCSGYLQKAKNAMRNGDVAVGIAEVEAYLEQGNGEIAEEMLRWLRGRAPKDKGVACLARKVYTELGRWDKLAKLIPDLRSLGLVTLEEKARLEDKAYAGIFSQSVESQDGNTMIEAWKRAPKTLRSRPEVVENYVRQLMKLGYGDAAESAIYTLTKSSWNDKLVYIYGHLESADAIRQLHRAESWLKGHPHSPVLMLTLGRLCIQNEQWKRACQYLEESIALHPYAETCRILGDLLEQLGETEAALGYYRQGIRLLGEDDELSSGKDATAIASLTPTIVLPSTATQGRLSAQ